METIHKFLEFFSTNVEKFALSVSIVAILTGSVASIFAHRAIEFVSTIRQLRKALGPKPVVFRHRTQDSATVPPPTPSQVARSRAASRIKEAIAIMGQQGSSAKWSKLSANLLTVGQYVIGGLLASSFVQESMSPRFVGVLGVLVLVASLVKQHFHPEVNAANALKKVAQLKTLIRTSEDQLTVLDAKIASGQDHSDTMISLLMQITQTLTEIETPAGVEATQQLPPRKAPRIGNGRDDS